MGNDTGEQSYNVQGRYAERYPERQPDESLTVDAVMAHKEVRRDQGETNAEDDEVPVQAHSRASSQRENMSHQANPPGRTNKVSPHQGNRPHTYRSLDSDAKCKELESRISRQCTEIKHLHDDNSRLREKVNELKTKVQEVEMQRKIDRTGFAALSQTLEQT